VGETLQLPRVEATARIASLEAERARLIRGDTVILTKK
jgi:hypothetical protein